MIFYDQRGTGRTQLKSRTRPEDITFAALMEDLQNTILWIKQTYKVDKIILLGLSWGSVLGTQYALLHPEDLLCYIGTGQLVSLKDGEKAGFDHTLEVIGTPDEEDKRILKQLGDYPYSIDPDQSPQSFLWIHPLFFPLFRELFPDQNVRRHDEA